MSDTQPSDGPPSEGQQGERHASWLELFFDLVVVVAVAQVSHRLHEPSWAELGISLLLFAAIWFCWVSFTLYANVRADETRTRVLLIAMAGIAVMAAAAQEADGERAVAFAVAYLAVRFLASQTWERTGSMLLAWPAAQAGAGVLPWLVSVWVDGPWRYGLWLLGLVIDVVIPIFVSREGVEAEVRVRQRYEQRLEQVERRRARQRRRGRESPVRPELTVAQIDTEHLAERLGLFIIIVLGEAVYQVVTAAAAIEWTDDFVAVSSGGFVIVAGLWWQTFRYGFSAAPHTRITELPARFALPVHMTITGGLMVMAAGLGSVAAHPDGLVPEVTGALLCGGLATYFVATTVLAVLEGAPRRWVFGWGVPAAVAAVGLAVASPQLPVAAVVWALVAVVGWQVAYAQWRT